MTKLSEMYREMVEKVCDETGVNESELFKSNREECVDARAILINALIRKGVTDTEAAKVSGLTRQCVNKLKNTFHLRTGKWTFDVNWKSVCRFFAL